MSFRLLLLLFIFSCQNPLGEQKALPDNLGLPSGIDQIDDDNSVLGFGGGTHNSTQYDGNFLTLNSTTNVNQLSSDWAPRWNNIIGLWHMDGTVGVIADGESVEDSSPSGVNGTIEDTDGANTIQYIDGKIGQAIQFDGANDRITMGSFDLTNKSFTISAWVYPANKGTPMVYFNLGSYTGSDPGERLHLKVDNDSFILFGYWFEDLESPEVAWFNQWHHIVVTYDTGTDTSKVFHNGIEIQSGSEGPYVGDTDRFTFGGFNYPPSQQYFQGALDEIAIWDVALSEDEIRAIYNRQNATFSGEFISRIIDSKSSTSDWSTLSWITPFPYSKQLNINSSESTSDYADITDNLMQDALGYWDFDGASGNLSDGEVVTSSGGSGLNGVVNDGDATNDIARRFGIRGESIWFDGSNDYLAMDPVDLNNKSFTISTWIYPYDIPSSDRTWIAFGTRSGVSNNELLHLQIHDDGLIRLGYWFDDLDTAVGVAKFNQWQHIVATYDINTDTSRLYFDGELLVSGNQGPFIGTSQFLIGYQGLTGYFEGMIDEVAVWQRPLSANEIKQLYQRTLSDVKFQVRTCSQPDCSDQASASYQGWKGPGGNALTWFSEYHNNSSISSSCSIPMNCGYSELSINGIANSNSASLNFESFGTDGIGVLQNRYFQYKVQMDANDQNTSCSGANCLPKIESVTIGPEHEI